MDLHDARGTEGRFRAYSAELVSVLGHADRVRPFEDYCIGLLTAEGRKSVEPLAAVTAPQRTAAQHQSLLHVVAQAAWSDAAILRRVRDLVLPYITRTEPLQAWIIDDTGFPKKGCHSVGVARQYCGQSGKRDNRQVAVSLSLATHQGSLPVAWRLYLPKDWADDPVRRGNAGVPADVGFQTKPEIALQQMRQALRDGVPPAVALMDPAYGNDSKLRAGMTELGLPYAVGVLPATTVWRSGGLARRRCHLLVKHGAAGPPNLCGAPRLTNRFRSKRWHWNWPTAHGSRSNGEREATLHWPRASHVCGCARRATTPNEASRPRKSGC